MLACHVSQFFEWLPWLDDVTVPDDDQARADYVLSWVARYGVRVANRYRDQLKATYGEQVGAGVQYAEAYELCEYGAELTPERKAKLFPFLP